MRPFPRLLAVRTIAATAVASLLLGGLLESCTTEAVGIEACRQIEAARCEALRICPVGKPTFKTAAEVETCSLFYRDQCLHGIASDSKTDPDQGQVSACVKAVRATAACAKMNATTMADCPAAPSAVPMDDPCIVISTKVDKLDDCNFVVAQGTGGTSSTSSSSSSSSASSTSSSSSSSSASSTSSASSSSSSSSASSSSGGGDAGTD